MSLSKKFLGILFERSKTMMLRNCYLGLLAIIGFLFIASTATAERMMIVNSSFEADTSGTMNITGWTEGNSTNASVRVWNAPEALGYDAADFVNVGQTQLISGYGGGRFYQVMNEPLKIGHTYTLSFYARNWKTDGNNAYTTVGLRLTGDAPAGYQWKWLNPKNLWAEKSGWIKYTTTYTVTDSNEAGQNFMIYVQQDNSGTGTVAIEYDDFSLDVSPAMAIANPDFELDDDLTTTMTGWNSPFTALNAKTFVSSGWSIPAYQGTKVALIDNNGYINQQLTETYKAGYTYTITYSVRSNNNATGKTYHTVGFQADGAGWVSSYSGWAYNTGWLTNSVVFTVPADSAAIGKDIIIKATQAKGQTIYYEAALFDHFSLSEEPAEVINDIYADDTLQNPGVVWEVSSGGLTSDDDEYDLYDGWNAKTVKDSLVIHSGESPSESSVPYVSFNAIANTKYRVSGWLAYAPGAYEYPDSSLNLRYSFVSAAEAAGAGASSIVASDLIGRYQTNSVTEWDMGVVTSDSSGNINIYLGGYDCDTSGYIGWVKFDIALYDDSQIFEPIPSNNACYVDFDAGLEWKDYISGRSYNVYLGKDFEDVNNAFASELLGNFDDTGNSFGVVDFADLVIFADEWLTSGTVANLSGDGDVDFEDFSIFASNWGVQSTFKGNQSDKSFTNGNLEDGIYYWRVDIVDGSTVYKGAVHYFHIGELVLNVSYFGALGNGSSDDTDAFYAASQKIQQFGGGTLSLGAGKTYRLGKQIHESGVYPYYQVQPVFRVEYARDRTVGIRGNGAFLKVNDGLKFGFFDKDTGAAYYPTQPFDDSRYKANATWGLIQAWCCSKVRVTNISIDGNISNLELGGNYGDYPTEDVNYSFAAYGINLNCNNFVVLDNVVSSYNGLDGIMISDTGLFTTLPEKEHKLNNVTARYNARNALSIVGGNKFTVTNSSFGSSGKAPGGFASSPKSGVDLEAEGAFIRNASFYNCVIDDCLWLGLVWVSDVAGCSFDTCTINKIMQWPVDPSVITFTNCTITN